MVLQKKPQDQLTLIIDQGSHASRIALFTTTGKQVYLESRDISTRSAEQANNQVTYEQDAHEILQSISNLLNALPDNLVNRIQNCGLCTQRSTIVAWHKTSGETLSPAISWRDTRAQPLIETLRPCEDEIRKTSGLALSAHYSASKIHWLLKHNLAVQQADKSSQLNISPLASFLLFHLLNEKPYLIDHSNAQRSQLFDIQQLNWSKPLLKLFHIKQGLLPVCSPMINLYGHLYLNNIPLTTVAGDQNASLHAFPPLHKNQALLNVGTGAFILSPATHNKAGSKLLYTLSSSDAKACRFVNEGTVNGAGSALSWQQKIDATHNISTDIFNQLPVWLKQIHSPPVFINTISGLGSPWWCSHAGEADFLSHTKTNRAERYVAIIESIIFLIFKNIQQLEIPPDTLLISGGLSQLDDLCHKLADLSQIKVVRFNDAETTARGCAWLANQLLKNNHLDWKPLEISQQFIPHKSHQQKKNIHSRYQQFVGELNKRCSSD